MHAPEQHLRHAARFGHIAMIGHERAPGRGGPQGAGGQGHKPRATRTETSISGPTAPARAWPEVARS
jgi:hypothetical protein